MPSLNNPLLQPKVASPAATPSVAVTKNVPIPENLLALNGKPVAPVLSDEDAYCWVFHPSYGFYFMEGLTNNHFRFFKGDGKGTSNTEVIPNKLYDDCNRGYMFVDRDKKQVQIQTAKLVKDYLDFVPGKVLKGFKDAFPGYEVTLKGCHMASLKQKVALDAMLETLDQEKHPDQEYTTQNGKMMGKGTEVEQGALNDGIPGSLLASDGSISGGTINDLTNTVVPGVPEEPTVEDATFFKESDEQQPESTAQEAQDEEQEQLSQEELARMKQADVKSYGAGTPNGGTPVAPKPSAANPTPSAPMPNAVPPVQSQNKTPQQLSQDAQGAPTEAGALTQQQLQQVLQTLKSSSVKISLGCGIEKEFSPDGHTIVNACTKELKNAGYVVKTAKTSAVHGGNIDLVIERVKTGAVVDAKDVAFRINRASNPDYFVRNFAAIPIKETPTSLPPRDDMRRHIDETAQDEVMEGVGNTPESKPTPSAPASVQPPQATPVAPSASQELLKQTLASYDGKKKLAYEWNADDDNSDDGESPSASKTAVQTEELVNLVCPACHGQEVQKLENTNQEDGSLVECLTCGCFFSL